MDIIIAKNSGLCYGVRRALQIAKHTRKKRKGPVWTLGDLIHNPQVIAELEAQDIHPVENIDRIEKGAVIIRSHGVSPSVYEALGEKDVEIIDATCPIVKKIQELVARLAVEEDEIVIVGNREHPETRGLIGYAANKGIVIENEQGAHNLPRKASRAVLAQSTQDLFMFTRVVAALIEKTEELKVHNTICRSTQTRQKSTSRLAARVDTLFIIGGKNSSNTQKLYEISRKILANTHFIESAAQITPEMIQGAKSIGLSGGASTPPEALQAAVERIQTCIQTHSLREKRIQ